MGRLHVFRALLAVLLGGGVAAAQQGLIVEPWHKAPAPVLAPVPAARPMPDSGLPPLSAAAPTLQQRQSAPPTAAPAPVKWTPPVVTLLVDPWSRTPVAAPAPRPRWVPSSQEIVDPWANEAAPLPRVASRPAETGTHSTIF